MKQNIKPQKLTTLQAAFIMHLLADPAMCAARAYKAAGYKCKSDNVATVEGCRLLKIPYIQEAMLEEKKRRANRLSASSDKTLLKLMRGQEFDVRKLYIKDAETGAFRLKQPHELCDDTAAAVIGVKYKDGLLEEYKIIDVLGCTKSVGEHLGMFKQRIEHTGKDGAPLEMNIIEVANRIAVLLNKARKLKKETTAPSQ